MMPANMDDNGTENRVPIKLTNTGDGLQCQWINTRSKRFTEPFFYETFAKLRILDPKNRGHLHTSLLDEMRREGQMLGAVNPAVIIFHVSRCGSTHDLAAFLQHPGALLFLSEVPFF